MVVLHLHTEHPREMFLSLQMLQAQYFCSLLTPVKCLEHILLKLIEYTKSKRPEKMLKNLWMVVNDQSTQNLRRLPSYFTYEPPLIFFSVFYMAFLCYYNCSANVVAEWKSQSKSSQDMATWKYLNICLVLYKTVIF